MLYNYEDRKKIKNTKEFRATNKPWNNLKLNQTKSIGSLMFLIKKAKPLNLQEWAEYYFSSGCERNIMITLNSHTPYNKEIKNKLLKEYGRTEEELIAISEKLAPYCNGSLELAYNYVYIRVIDETWIGYQKEVLAMKHVEEFININNYPAKIKEVSVEKDIKYSVDFELFIENKLSLGIQLKSIKYKENNGSLIRNVKFINEQKNALYSKRYNVEVLYLYYKDDKIININDLKYFFKDKCECENTY